MSNTVVYGDNLTHLKQMSSESVDMIYLDPPFGTDEKQVLHKIKAVLDREGLEGFQKKKYRREVVRTIAYEDKQDDWMSFMWPRLVECHRIAKETSLTYQHLDYRNVHYGRLLMDEIWGDENFVGEIIWSLDFGGRGKRFFPRKHNNILVYSKSENYFFDLDKAERLPYMSPALVGEEKTSRGKPPTDVLWVSIEGTNSSYRWGYPTEKPYKLLEYLVKTSLPTGGMLLDPFAGSGKIGLVAHDNGGYFTLLDYEENSIEIMREHLPPFEYIDSTKVP